MNYRDLFELGANRRSAIRTKGQKEADTRWNQSVMSRPDTGPGWVPEYVREPGLEAPMFAPDDLIGTGIPTKLAMLAKAGLGGLAGVAGMGAVKAAGGSTLSDVVKGSARKVAVGQEGGTFLDTADLARRTVEAPIAGRGNKLMKTGEGKNIYAGTEAFGGISPQRVGQMRKDYLQHMEQGAVGRNWYDNASRAIRRWTGDNLTDADKMANALAITSSRTPVAPNLMYANRGWNQYLAGDPVHTGGFPSNMGRQIEEAFSNPEVSASGLKRSPYSAGLSVDWRGPEFVKRATHDIHDVRAWGIMDPITGDVWSKGVPAAGHRFLDQQAALMTNRANKMQLAGLTGWTPYNAQAAAWISQKAKREGKPIGETALDYSFFAPDYQAQIAREWVPSTRSPHLPELHAAGPGVKSEFSDALEAVNTGPQGIDRLARGIGALTDTTIPNVGMYEGVSNPGFLSQINVGKMAAPQTYADQAMDPSSRKVIEAVSAAHGLTGVQDQVGYNFLTSLGRTGGPASQSSGFRIDYGGQLPDLGKTVSELQDIGVHLPLNDPQGIRGLQFTEDWAGPGTFSPEIRRSLKQYAENTGGDLRWFNNSGDIFPKAPSESWSSKPFVAGIEAGGPRIVENFNRTMQGGYAQDMLGAVRQQAEKHGLTVAPYYEPMMQALSSGGLPALKDLIAKGVVPAVVLGYLGFDQMNPESGYQ